MHTYPSQCGSWLSLLGSVVSSVTPASSHSSGCISSLGSTSSGSVGIPSYLLMSFLLHLWKPSTSGGLGTECFQPSLGLSDKLCISSSTFSCPGSIHVPGGTCHQSIQTSCFCGTLFHRGSLASHTSQHVGGHSTSVSYHKGPCHGCLSRLGPQGSAVTAFTPFAVQR